MFMAHGAISEVVCETWIQMVYFVNLESLEFLFLTLPPSSPPPLGAEAHHSLRSILSPSNRIGQAVTNYASFRTMYCD